MDLQFDKMTLQDTSLAQAYIKSNERLSELYEDYIGMTEKYVNYTFDGKVFERKTGTPLISDADKPYDELLRELASRLKQNATLIAQLEYFTRNIPVEDTNVQLNLIIQYLKCIPSKNTSAFVPNTERMYSNDPLLVLGTTVERIMRRPGLGLLNNMSKDTAAISHLFVKLCKEAGINRICVTFLYDIDDDRRLFGRTLEGFASGTVAVVSEDADVDSAVDTFISASKQAPWRLRRILVQESVYQQFKDALSWKCNLKKQGGESLTSDVLCSEALTYNGRVFLIDPVGSPKDQQSAVTVEAYRTIKEMISLVKEDKTRYLSLWANDIAEINEVTHSMKSRVVWVNNLADFRGRPQIAEAVFPYLYDSELLIKKCDKISKLCELSQSWQRLDFESRRDILYNALNKCMISDSNNHQEYMKIRNSLADCTMNSFVDVGKDYVCVGMSTPVGIIGIPSSENISTVENFKSILYGNAFVIHHRSYCKRHFVELDVLEQAGVPVIDVGEYVEGDFVIGNYPDTPLRVVWTNSGTIFAN